MTRYRKARTALPIAPRKLANIRKFNREPSKSPLQFHNLGNGLRPQGSLSGVDQAEYPSSAQCCSEIGSSLSYILK
jgi:hypothetical protein